MTNSPAELFDRFHLAIYRYLLRMTGRCDVAEDLTQDVFVRILGGGAADSRRTESAADSPRFTQKGIGLTPRTGRDRYGLLLLARQGAACRGRR